MLKITGLVLCILAASLTKVSAVTEEDKAAYREVLAPIIAECSSEHGVTEAEIEAAKKAIDPSAVKPCFLGCLLKKTGFLDSKGLYDSETGLANLKHVMKNEEDFAKYEEIGKKCMKVNDEPVSDGEAGCDRAMLALACGLEHKVDVSL